MIGLLLAGRATIQSLTRDASDEFCLCNVCHSGRSSHCRWYRKPYKASKNETPYTLNWFSSDSTLPWCLVTIRNGRGVVFCVFALVTNLVIMIGLLLAGRATIQSLTRDASDEFCLFVMAILFGSYSLIGGIGTTFYVSYFNACLVFILLIVFVIKILHNQNSEFKSIGDVSRMYESISCVVGPKENVDNSYLNSQHWEQCMPFRS
jgi:hypothetical protein